MDCNFLGSSVHGDFLGKNTEVGCHFLLPQLYMTTGKTIPLTTWTFVGKVLSLLFNTLSRFVIAFLPRRSGRQHIPYLIKSINI